MKNKIPRIILYVFCWLVGSFFLFYFAYRGSRDTSEKYQSEIDSIYSKIEFSGEIMKIYETNHGGRPNGVICVRIDTANLTEFYRFNKYTCLKIHKGIASIPADYVKLISQAKYLEVNKNKNRKMIYYNSANEVIFEDDLLYWSAPVKEYDMWRCDTCQ